MPCSPSTLLFDTLLDRSSLHSNCKVCSELCWKVLIHQCICQKEHRILQGK